MKTFSIILVAGLLVTSCGKSKVASELQKATSELSETYQAEEQTSIYDQNSNLGVQKNRDEINEFQKNNVSTTTENQLEDAHLQLNGINTYRYKVKNEIAHLQQDDTFDYLKSPESLMNYLFKSAKNGDFSNFHYLCDPYGKNDGDTKEICSLQMHTKEQQQEYITYFENAKIIGQPKIMDDKAEVEFEFGPNSDKRETMHLVSRNGLWYLDSF